MAVLDDYGAALLREPFRPEQVGKLPRTTKDGRRIDLAYVGHAAVTARLLRVDATWTWEPLSFAETGAPYIGVRGGEASMWIRLTICGVTRIGVGTARADELDLSKKLISDALRNAAMRFGVALDLWSKEEIGDFPPEVGERPAKERPSPMVGERSKREVPARPAGKKSADDDYGEDPF